MRSALPGNRRGQGDKALAFGCRLEYASRESKNMRNVAQACVPIGLFAVGAFSQSQQGPEITSANPDLVPQDFTVDDVPISVKVPFEVFVNGKPW